MTKSNEKTAGLQKKVSLSSEKTAGLQKKVTPSSEKTAGLQKKVSSSNKKRAGLQKKVTSSSKKTAGLQKKVTSSNKKTAGLQKKVSSSNKKRAGLQKKVSSVFEGVPIPNGKHKDRSDRMPSPPRRAASELPKPSDSQTCQDPVVTRLDQPAESVDRTVLGYIATYTPPTSTDSEDPQNPDAGKADVSEEVAERTVPEYMAASTPPTSTDSEGPQNPDAGKADASEEVAERTVPEYVAASTPSISTNREDSRGPVVGKPDQSEESTDRTVSGRFATLPEPGPAERQSSQSSLIRRMAECEKTSYEPAPIEVKDAEPKQPKAPGHVVHSGDPQGATAPSGNDARQPDGKHAQDRAGEPPATATTKDRQCPPSPQIQKPHRPEQPAAKATQPKQPAAKTTQPKQPAAKTAEPKQPMAPGYVVHSGDPQGATIKRPVIVIKRRIRDRLFTSKAGGSTTKQKTMATVMPVLFIILLVFVFKGGVFGTKVRKTKASGQDNVSNVATADSNNEIDWEIPAPYPATLRDPMRLGPVEDAQTETETETRTPATLIVKGIMYSKDSRSAVIGSQIAHEGDQILGVTVVRISKDSIEFEMNGKRWTQVVQ